MHPAHPLLSPCPQPCNQASPSRASGERSVCSRQAWAHLLPGPAGTVRQWWERHVGVGPRVLWGVSLPWPWQLWGHRCTGALSLQASLAAQCPGKCRDKEVYEVFTLGHSQPRAEAVSVHHAVCSDREAEVSQAGSQPQGNVAGQDAPSASHIPVSLPSGVQSARPASWAPGPSHNACRWPPPLGFPADWGLASHPQPGPPPGHTQGPALIQR